MKIVFVNRYFWPDHSATSQILSDLAFALAARGREVAVVTSRLAYGDEGARFPARETRAGVTIHRVATTGFGRRGLLGRSMDYLSFYLAAMVAVFRLVRRGDVLVVKTDPPLLSVALAPVAALRGARQVNWLQDIYPEVAAALGIGLAGGMTGKVLRGLRDWSLRRSALQVVLGERMRARLVERGIAPERIAIIANFTDDAGIVPLSHGGGELRRDWGFAPGDLVVGYSGNLGRAHDLGTIMQAARLVQERGLAHIRFLFIGGGALFETIEDAVQRHALNNVTIKPYQPREMLCESLAVPDLHLISLRPEMEGSILPSKFYGVLAAGRGVAFIGDPQGDVGAEIERERIGRSVAIGEGEALAACLARLAGNRAELEEMGHRARALMERKYLRRQAIDLWEAALERLAS